MYALYACFLIMLCREIPTFRIPLDGDDYQRYLEPTTYLKEPTLVFMSSLFKVINKAFMAQIKQTYQLSKHQFPRKVKEIQGIAAVLGKSEEDMFVYQFIYEVYAYCTTIIARDNTDRIIVGRNLDYMFIDELASTHYMAIFTLDGIEKFRCTHYGGFVGANTCMKSSSYILTLNSRESKYDTSKYDNLIAFQSGALLVTWAILEAFNSTSTFEQLVDFASNQYIAAPAYYNIAGRMYNEGCVINRERNCTYSKYCLDSDTWYIVQVNDDYDDPIPANKRDRRTPAQNKLNELTDHNVTLEYLFDILKEFPNNNEMTIYTALMDLEDNTFEVVFWA